VSLRYFNAAGAAEDASIGEDPTRTLNLIPLVMQALLGRRPPVQVFGIDYPTPDGTAIRDYIHVDDLADAHVRALDFLTERGLTATVNLGTGLGSSVREVLARAPHLPSWVRVYSTTSRICAGVRTPPNEGMVSNALDRPFVTTVISSSTFRKSLVTWAASRALWQFAHLAWKTWAPCWTGASVVDVELVDRELVWRPLPPQAETTKPVAATSPITLAVERHTRFAPYGRHRLRPLT
jgi:NAD dependent epimerase/dehydratase family